MAKVDFIDTRVEVFITEESLSKIKDVQANLMAKLPEGAKTTALNGAYTGMIAISTLPGKRGISSNLRSQNNG